MRYLRVGHKWGIGVINFPKRLAQDGFICVSLVDMKP